MASFSVAKMNASAMAGQTSQSKVTFQPGRRFARACVRPAPSMQRSCQRLVVRAHGTAEETTRRMRPGEKKGFVEEMRFVAMRLHTKEQAPKEGQAKPAPNPMAQVSSRFKNHVNKCIVLVTSFITCDPCRIAPTVHVWCNEHVCVVASNDGCALHRYVTS